MNFIDKHILGKPQPIRLYKKVSRREKIENFVKEWKSIIMGFLLANILIVSFMPFL